MNIVIKFGIGNIIWYMRDNRPVQGKISEINIKITEDGKMSLYYIGNWCGTTHKFLEYKNSVFATKEELLKSL